MRKIRERKGYILIVLVATLPVLLLGIKYVINKIQMNSQSMKVNASKILLKPGVCEDKTSTDPSDDQDEGQDEGQDEDQ
ncbi:MAG: hypothetical protein LBB12_00655 [Holosporaceae bacterium]|jgi:hypothetical protein|nr:hypothetical protein [Holosporaceae bacterium]